MTQPDPADFLATRELALTRRTMEAKTKGIVPTWSGTQQDARVTSRVAATRAVPDACGAVSVPESKLVGDAHPFLLAPGGAPAQGAAATVAPAKGLSWCAVGIGLLLAIVAIVALCRPTAHRRFG